MAILETIETPGAATKIIVKSPVTLQKVGEFECTSEEEVRAAVVRAREAQKSWGSLSVDERAGYMLKLLHEFVTRQEEIIEVVMAETGKPRSECISMEIFASCDAIGYYAKRAKKFLRPEKRRIHGVLGLTKKLKVVYKPRGVVGLITPWNGPVVLGVNPAVQAMMAGNTVVHKPSEVTPFSADLIKRFTEAAGFPKDVYQVIQGDGRTGAALLDAGVNKVSFTGSVATGRRVAEACARNLIPCSLELGGKDAMIVCDDADLDRAAQGALFGSCMNVGHFCCGTERIYVHERVYDEFLAKVVEGAKALRQSDKGECDVGAVFWDKQMDIIEAHMADAVEKGAEVLVGGGRTPGMEGLWFQPTVVAGVTHDMDLMSKETFGPVVSIMKVRDEEEGLRHANDSIYGLNGNVWTKNIDKGFRLAERMDTGSVCVNDMAITYGVHEAPFGGVKESGVGQVNGQTGLRSYCHAQPIIADRWGTGKIQGAYPYTRESEEQMQKFVKFLWGTSFGRLFS